MTNAHDSRRPLARLIALTALSGLVVAACNSSDATSPGEQAGETAGSVSDRSERRGSDLVLLQGAEPQCLDPYESTLTHTGNVVRNVYDELAMLDVDLAVVPRLAVSWEPDGSEAWVVELRDDAKFSNGAPVTAADVVATLNYAKTSNGSNWFARWTRAEAMDEHTVRIETDGPDAAFENSMTRLYVMSQEQVENDPESLCAEPIGSGSHKLERWSQGQEIVLSPNEHSVWESALDTITIKAVPEDSTRINMLLTGGADLVANVSVESIDQVEASEVARVESSKGIRQMVNIIDTRSAPFDDVNVRRALAHAVDMPTIVEAILDGHATPSVSARPPGTPFADPKLEPYAYDPELARTLLREAGYPDGFQMDYHYPVGRWLKDGEVAQAIASYLEAVGIQVNLQTTQYETFFNDWAAGKYTGMTMIGTIDADGNPTSTDRAFLSSEGPWSFSWSSSEFDSLLEQAETAIDPDLRLEKLQAMDRMIYEQAIYCCGYVQDEIFGVAEGLEYSVHPAERIDLRSARWADE